MPWFRKTLLRKAAFLGGLCSVLFLLGLPMVCNAGIRLSSIVDEYSTSFGALIIGIFEMTSVAWIYGSWNYHKDLKMMLGHKWPNAGRWYLFIFWGFVAPGLICVRITSDDSQII